MTDKIPTYEELLANRVSPLALRIAAMQPGDVIDAGPATVQRKVSTLILNPRAYVRTHSSQRYATRTRDGRCYVICLRPEDRKNGASK